MRQPAGAAKPNASGADGFDEAKRALHTSLQVRQRPIFVFGVSCGAQISGNKIGGYLIYFKILADRAINFLRAWPERRELLPIRR
jgi:hypothetical protein